MPSNFAIVYRDGRYRIGDASDPVTLSFTRRGLWLGADEIETTSTTISNPEIETTTSFSTAANALSPYDLKIEMATNGDSSTDGHETYILASNNVNYIWLTEGEDESGVVPGSSTTGTTAIAAASGGSVRYLRPDSVGDHALLTGNGETPYGQLVSVFLVLRTKGGSITWTTYAQLEETGYGNIEGVSRSIVLDPSNTDPQIVHYSLIASPRVNAPGRRLRFVFTNDIVAPANAGAHDLEIDYAAGIGHIESSAIIKMTNAHKMSGGSDIFVEHRLDSHLSPVLSDLGGSGTQYPGATGNRLLSMTGSSLTLLYFGLDNVGSWRFYSGGATTLDHTVTRQIGYLTPL
jgi:hypothetical protein